jgi:thiosulfate/3-mercaptopyruvate sulfurtransferase
VFPYGTLAHVDDPIIDAAALAARLARAEPLTLLDASFTLTGAGRSMYDAGHLPGAVFVDVDRDLSGPPGPNGRHPLPDPEALQAALRRLGVRADRPVVVYEQGPSAASPLPIGSAARTWWTLTWAGHPRVHVLDGGLAAWTGAGHPVTSEPVSPEPGDFEVRPGHLPVWTAADAARAAERDRVLIDARAPERFRGEVEPIDTVAGHIPGAVNQPLAAVVDGHGRLKGSEALRASFAALGVRRDRPVGAYCGSGITAAETVLALRRAGYAPALYVGSWSDWITDPARPVATGEAEA